MQGMWLYYETKNHHISRLVPALKVVIRYNETMPGYLSNRLISLNPAQDVAAVESDVTALTTRVTEAEANIDDLSLNIGV